MAVPQSVDKYLIVAHQRGLLEIKDRLVILTEEGRKELDAISDECLTLMRGSLGSDFDKMSEQLSGAMGRIVSPRETFQMVMRGMVGTEARVLAFLLNEKESNFDALTKAIAETMSITASINQPQPPTDPTTKVTPFRKKPKLDS